MKSVSKATPNASEDVWHRVPTEDKGYRESYYFDFVDPGLEIAGFTSIGWRPNSEVLGGTTVLFLPEGAYMAQHQRETESDFPVLQVGGLRYQRVSDELGHWRFIFDGEMRASEEFGSGVVDREPSGLASPCSLDLTFVPTRVPIVSRGEPFEGAFDEHWEQSGEVRGSVTAPKGSHPETGSSFDGLGERDRSWGVRDWVGFRRWMYVSGHCPASDTSFQTWFLDRYSGESIQTGWLSRRGESVEIVRSCAVETSDVALPCLDGRFPQMADVRWWTDASELAAKIRSWRVVPLTFESRRGVSSMVRGMAQIDLGELGDGWGQVEYLCNDAESFVGARLIAGHSSR